MAKFRKLIVTPGVHNVGRLNGKTEAEALTRERLQTWVDNTNRLLSLGVSIPAPFAHQDKNRHFPLPVVRVGEESSSLADAYNPANGLSWDAQLNGGFWEQLAIDPQTGGINAIVDAPGDSTDANTPAGKVGSVVRETSVLVMGPRKIMVDGKEHEIGEHLAHVAMCLHPAQAGQRNFEPVTEGQLSASDLKVAMSICMADLVDGGPGTAPPVSGNTLPDPTKPRDLELDNLLAMLRNVCYIDLPETTTRETLVTDLSLALRQKSADQQEQQKEEDKLTQRPLGTETKSPSIAMSQQANGFAPVNSPAPAAPTAADTTLALLMSNLVVSKKDTLRKRILSLVSSGRCSQQYAQEKLLPKVEGFAMSAEQLTAAGGDVSKLRDPIEDLIEGLEQAQPLAGPSLLDSGADFQVPPGADVQEVPSAGLPDLSDADADEIIGFSLNYSL